MRNKITEAFLKSPPAYTERLEVFDTTLPGFGVRFGIAGRRTFFVFYRVYRTDKKQQVRETLGPWPALTLAEAREKARKIMQTAQAGIDPRADRHERRHTSVAAVAAEFLERYAAKQQQPTTYRETTRYINAHLVAEIGHKSVRAVTRGDLVRLLDNLVDAGKPIAANRLRAALSKFFAWSISRGYVDMSPAQGIEAPGVEQKRSRVLTTAEVRAIWNASATIGYPFGSFAQLKFATGGQRERDVAHMRWDEIRGDVWTIATPTKSKEAHAVPLSSLALQLLDSVPRMAGPYVLSTTAGARPISGFGKAKERLDAASGVTGWRFHDIRRTVATGFAEALELHPYIVEQVQNRSAGTIRGVMRVYNRAPYEKAKRDALERWGDYLRGVIADNVVELRSRG